jgi:hypothetical protein
MLAATMSRQSLFRPAASVLVVALLVSGCSSFSGISFRELAGFAPQADPSVAIRPTEARWLLIKNPRFGDVASEPEYVWVEEDKVPTTFKSFFLGKSTLLASPEVVARYGPPPGGGRISPRQGGPYQVESVSQGRGPIPTQSSGSATAPPPAPKGYVVYVDTGRVVIDLTKKDGVQVGAPVSVRRDRIAIVHPITGELLGELDEEVAAGRIVEVRDRFSVVEIQSVTAGGQVQVKDRVVVR